MLCIRHIFSGFWRLWQQNTFCCLIFSCKMKQIGNTFLQNVSKHLPDHLASHHHVNGLRTGWPKNWGFDFWMQQCPDLLGLPVSVGVQLYLGPTLPHVPIIQTQGQLQRLSLHFSFSHLKETFFIEFGILKRFDMHTHIHVRAYSARCKHVSVTKQVGIHLVSFVWREKSMPPPQNY